MVSYDTLKANERFHIHHDRIVMSEEGLLELDQYQKLRGYQYDEAMNDAIDQGMEFISGSAKALISRVETLKLLGVRS